jgi:CRP/FNR family transcriptional regulator, cyclic AMP receptor protein
MPTAKLTEATSTRTYPNMTTLLGQISQGMHAISVRKGEKIFSQDDPSAAIYFVQTGRVKISVLSCTGKEAVLGILGPDAFFGEECLVGQSLRINSAMALEPSSVFQVQKRVMLRALHAQPELSERFTTSLLKRAIDLEEDLCDQFFNQSEKRLARVLLKLARLREHQVVPDTVMPTLGHATLAEIVGTTRSRITYFMNKFRKMGLIDYDGHLIVITERLINVVLRD